MIAPLIFIWFQELKISLKTKIQVFQNYFVH